MQLLDHVSITVRDIAPAKPFYRALMSALGADGAYERDDAIDGDLWQAPLALACARHRGR